MFDLIMNFSIDLEYLKIEQARLWLQHLKDEELKRNKDGLSELIKCVEETLNEGQFDYHIEESALKFIEEIKMTQ